jgi:uncharacterized protein (TIGR02996 family)
MNLRDAFLEDVLAWPEDPAVKLIFADWLDENGRPDLAHAYRWMARRGYRPGQRQRPLARKPWAWWHPRSIDLEDPPDRPDVQRCPHAVLPMPVFRALGGQEKFGAHAWFRTYADAARALGDALQWLRELTDLEGPGPEG